MELKAKDVREKCPFLLSYCDFYYISQFFSRLGYNAGVYGRNCDVYRIGWYYFTIGDRPIGKRPNNRKDREKLNKKCEKYFHTHNREQIRKYKSRLEKQILKLCENA